MKKAVSMFLTAALAVSCLAGCGSSAGNISTGNASAGADSSASDDSAADGSVFKIGSIGPTTGDAAIYGNAVMNAAQMAVDEINAAGGANGYQLAFKAEDDQNDAEKSVNAYNSLKDWGMQILMGTVTTTPCVAVADKTAEDGMFEITPSASSTDVITNDNVFQACFTDPNQGTASAQYIADNNLGTKVAVIYDSSSVYSSGIEATFVEEAQNKGLEVVAEEAFTADSKTDFSTQLQKAQSAGADLVFLPIYYTEASIILTQANGMGYEPAFFGVDGMDGILGVENFDTSLAEGVMLLTPFAADADDEKTKAFVSTYKEKYGDVPNQFAADAYDAVYAVKAAAEKEDVKAELKDGYLTVSAAKGLDQDEQEKETGRYIRRERYAGSMMRSFYVGDEIKQEDIHAKFENGILQLSIPKKEAKAIAQNNYIAIE